MSDLQELSRGLFANKGAPRDEIERAERDLDLRFPADLVTFLTSHDAAEGFVAGGYLQMWPVAEMANLNRIARVPEFVPGLVIVATNAGGEGFGIDRSTSTFIRLPMIGMSRVDPDVIGTTFEDLLRWIANHGLTTSSDLVRPPARYGLVIFEKQPIILGGSPTDISNKALVPLAKYVELVAWWNNALRESFGSGS